MPASAATSVLLTAPTSSPDAALLLVLVVLLPFVGVMFGLLCGARHAQRVAQVTLVLGLAIALACVGALLQADTVLVYALGGWAPPLGVALRADGLSAVMLLTTAVVVGAVGLYAGADFGARRGEPLQRAGFSFWLLLLAIWGTLNLVLVSADLFTLYVALELLTFAGVPLVCLDGRGETLRAALRYLLFGLLGSMLYLLGMVLLYGTYGTLDIALLATLVHPGLLTGVAAALMTVGLLAKTALFPLHIWLPPAHASAPAAASALLSGLVIKGSWFLLVRLWFDVLPAVVTLSSAQLLGALGAAAIVFGNLMALRQARLKLLIAYSTVAQIGYLFLLFPLAFSPVSGQIESGLALTGGMLHAMSHATAKAAMFMAAGLISTALGHDRIADFAGVARALPVTVVALALGGITLIGLPPSGGFLAKWLLLSAAVASGQWWWALVLLVGGLLTSAYLFVLLARALRTPRVPLLLCAPVARYRELTVLGLALCSALLGLVAFVEVDLLQIGRQAVVLGGAS